MPKVPNILIIEYDFFFNDKVLSAAKGPITKLTNLVMKFAKY